MAVLECEENVLLGGGELPERRWGTVGLPGVERLDPEFAAVVDSA